MFYWIHLSHWQKGSKEAQFYLNEQKEMLSFIQKNLKEEWVIDCMKLMNNIKGK